MRIGEEKNKTAVRNLERAFGEVVVSQRDAIHARIRHLCCRTKSSTESEDVVQDVFLRFWVAICDGSFEGLARENPVTDETMETARKWLFVTARFVVSEYVRRSQRRQQLKSRLLARETGDASIAGITLEEVRDSICQCTSEEQEVLVLLLDGNTQQEVAQRLQMSRNTVIRRIDSATKRLRRLFGADLFKPTTMIEARLAHACA